VQIPGIKSDNVNHFNVFDAPYYYNEINRLSRAYKSGTENAFFSRSLSNVSPQSDNKPFPYKHLKWQKLKKTYKTTGSRPYSLFLSGEIVVSVVFAEAVLISILLLVIPFLTVSKQTKHKIAFSKINYFFWVGAGFMFVELYFIKQYILLFGNPVISFSVVLAGILITSGIGGIFSQKIYGRHIRNLLLLLIGVLCLCWLNGDMLCHALLGYSDNIRFILGTAGLILPGILMGFPFTMGMRWLTCDARERAYAWAANGCASVLTAILSAHIALNLGINAILFFAIIAYSLAFISAPGRPGLFRLSRKYH
jgi:hypothetical protein